MSPAQEEHVLESLEFRVTMERLCHGIDIGASR
jgi:hypothetical protein